MTTHKFFTPGMTREEIKDQYHKLAKRYHPDLGGDTATMQELNNQYTAAMDAATRNEMPGRSEKSYTYQATTNEVIRSKMEEAARMMNEFPHLSIEICGYWLWCHGTTYADKAIPTLKAAGYHYAPKKHLWFYATIPSKRHTQEWDMNDIRNAHGSEYIPHQQRQEEPIQEIS